MSSSGPPLRRHCLRQMRSQLLLSAKQLSWGATLRQAWKLQPHCAVHSCQHGTEAITEAERRDSVRSASGTRRGVDACVTAVRLTACTPLMLAATAAVMVGGAADARASARQARVAAVRTL